MDREGGESLRRALREADVRQRRLTSSAENVVDGIGNIMKRELVHGEIPEGGGCRGTVDAFFGIFIAPIIPKLEKR